MISMRFNKFLPVLGLLLLAVSADAQPEIPMVHVAEGAFDMGLTDSGGDPFRFSIEIPVHSVHLDAYEIGVHEITNAQFSAVINWAFDNKQVEAPINDAGPVLLNGRVLVDTGNQNSALVMRQGRCVVVEREGRSMDDFPVVLLSWHGAAAFCNWLSQWHGHQAMYDLATSGRTSRHGGGYRLPTEAEWERAAAWSSEGKHMTFAYPSEEITFEWLNYFNWKGEVYVNPAGFGIKPFLSPVGWFQNRNGVDARSPVGCYDMSGNVWEWCEDWFAEDYYANSPPFNPTGPDTGTARVNRGGSWRSDAVYCRTAMRNFDAPEFLHYDLGFRIARSIRE